MPPIVARLAIGALLIIGATVHGLHAVHASRADNLTLRLTDIVVVVAALGTLFAMLPRNERADDAAGWGAVLVLVMLVLALMSI